MVGRCWVARYRARARARGGELNESERTRARARVTNDPPDPSPCSQPPVPSRRLTAAFPVVDPNPMRWRPMPMPPEGTTVDFVDGLATMCGAGSAQMKEGVAIHL